MRGGKIKGVGRPDGTLNGNKHSLAIKPKQKKTMENKMKLYAYNQESMSVVAIINGESNDECERKAEENGYYPGDDIAWTYSPAFGCSDGLVESEDAGEIE